MASIDSQIAILLDILTRSNFKLVTESIESITKLYGDIVLDFAMHILLRDITSFSPKKDKQKIKIEFTRQFLDTLFYSKPERFLSALTRAFGCLAISPEFLTLLFKKLSIPIDQQIFLSVTLSHSSNAALAKQSVAFLNNPNVLTEIIKALKEDKFSMRVLQELLYNVQKFGHFENKTRSEIMGLVGEEAYGNKNMHKALRLFVFQQNIFNYKTDFNSLESLSAQLEESLFNKIENSIKNDDSLSKFINCYRFYSEDNLINVTNILSEKIADKDKKTLSAINLNSLIESFDCNFLNTNTFKAIKNALKTVLPFLARKANKKLLSVLYTDNWSHETAHLGFLKISMGFPDEMALTSRRKIDEAKKMGDKWYETGLNHKSKSFYSSDFAETLLNVGKGKEARSIVETVLKKVAEKDPVFVFSALSQLKSKSMLKTKLLAHITKTALNRQNAKFSITDLFKLNAASAFVFLNTIFEMDPSTLSSIFKAFEESQKGTNSSKKLKMLKPTETPLLLKTAIAIEIAEKHGDDFDSKFFAKNDIDHIQTLFYYNLSGQLARFTKKSPMPDSNHSEIELYSLKTVLNISQSFKSKAFARYIDVYKNKHRTMEVTKEVRAKLKEYCEGEMPSEIVLKKEWLGNAEKSQIFINEALGMCSDAIKANSINNNVLVLERVSPVLQTIVISESLNDQQTNALESLILECLKSESHSKQFLFASEVLKAVITKTESFPTFFKTLLDTKSLHSKLPNTVELAKKLAQSAGKKPAVTKEIKLVERRKEVQPRLVQAISDSGELKNNTGDDGVNKVVAIKLSAKQVEEKVVLLLNNLSEDNYNDAAAYIDDDLPPTHHTFFAHYFISQKVAAERNYHEVFFLFHRLLLRKELKRLILASAYAKTKELASTESLSAAPAPCQKLANMGNWLGGTLLRQNRPILSSHVDFKSLLVEAFFPQGQKAPVLLSTVVFASTALQQSARSTVFRPPNPWLMGVLSVMKEIYDKDVEMNVRFEIERLFKELNVDIVTMRGRFVLAMRDFGRRLPAGMKGDGARAGESEMQKTLGAASEMVLGYGGCKIDEGFLKKVDLEMKHLEVIKLINDPVNFFNQTIQAENRSFDSLHSNEESIIYIKTFLLRHIAFNPKCFPVGAIEAEKSAHRDALAIIMANIFLPLVARSVGIASLTMLELITKDFGYEPNEAVFIAGAAATAHGCAGSLLLATIREPLRAEIHNAIRGVLKTFHNDMNLVNSACLIMTKENFLVCCQLLCNLADTRIKREVCLAIQNSVELRRKYKSEGLYFPGENISKNDGTSPIFPNCLPFDLQPKRNGLTPKQNELYQKFQPMFEAHQRVLRDWAVGPEFYSVGAEEPAEDTALLHYEGIIGNGGVSELEFLNQIGDNFDIVRCGSESVGDNMDELIKKRINKNEIANFETIKAFNHSELLRRYDALARSVKSHPDFASSLRELPQDSPLRHEISDFFSYLATQCFNSVEDQRKVMLLLLADHVYNEMFNLSFNLVFLDFLAEILDFIRNNANGLESALTIRLTRFYVKEPDTNKYTMEVFKRLMIKKLLDVEMVDMYFATLISNKKPYIHSRAVYFLAAFLNALGPDQPRLPAPKFPRLARVFAEIEQGLYKADLLNKTPLPAFFSPAAQPAQTTASAQQLTQQPAQRKQAGTQQPTPQPALSDRDRAQMLSAPALPPDHGAAAKLLLREWHKSRGRQTRQDFVRSARAAASLDDAAFLRVLVHVVLDAADAARTPAAADAETDALAALLFTFAEAFVFPAAAAAGPTPGFAAAKPAAPGAEKTPGSAASLLKHFRALIGGILSSHASPAFRPRPAHRLLGRLLRLYRFEDHPADKARTQALVLFIELFTHLQPLRAPGFAFSWLALVTDRCFLRPLLQLTDSEYAGKCRFHTTRLLCAALAFMAPMLAQAWGRPFDEALRRFYAAALRTLTLLARDHGGFVAEFYFDLAGAAPLRCVQLRNVVLASVPPDARPAGYFYGAVESVLGPAPAARPSWGDLLEACEANKFGAGARGLKPALDEVVRRLAGAGPKAANDRSANDRSAGAAPGPSGPVSRGGGGGTADKEFYAAVAAKLAEEEGRGYRRGLLAAAVAYVGFGALEEVRRARERRGKLDVAAALDRAFLFFVLLLRELAPEGKYYLVSSLVDHVRYHSPHTHLFSLAVLSVFGKSEESEVREITFRVLMERLGSYGPHPQGLVALFVEFSQNPFYNVSLESFASCSPSVSILYKSLCDRFNGSTRNSNAESFMR